MHQYKNKIIQKNRGFIAYSAIKMPAKPPCRNPLRTSAKLSPMIGKILLYDNFNSPIRPFQLSPKKLFPIIGESLTETYPRITEKRPFCDKVRKSRAFIG